MAKTLVTLRAELARRVARYLTGTATSGSTTTVVDTGGLAHYTETDALKGALVHIVTAGGAAPEGEDRVITGYNATTKTITVSKAFTATVQNGDTYAVYLAPLSLAQWNLAINLAIQDAYPMLWDRDLEEETITGATYYALDAAAEEVDKVEIIPVVANAGLYGREIPRGFWTVEGLPGSQRVYLQRPIAATPDLKLHIYTKKRFAELTTDSSSTALDPGYLLAAARANWYGLMADAARGQADVARFLQLMNHWQGVAERRKRELAAMLTGIQPKEGKD